MGVSRRGFLGRVAASAAAGAATGMGVAEPAAAADGPGPAVGPVAVTGMRTDREWRDFLAAQDPRWRRLPRAWYEGPFLGNGLLGSIVYREPGANALRFTVHHTEVQDHRPEFGHNWGLARLPVGNLLLRPVGAITGADLRLDLWNAEISGTVTTDKGSIELRALVHNDRTLLLVTATASAGERDFRWEFVPSPAVNPRIVRENPPEGLESNPDPVITREPDGTGVVVQPLVAGGQTVTAHRERTVGGERVYVLSVAHSHPGIDAEGRAGTAVRKASALPVSSLLRTHREWWHRFYRKSFLSVPDGMLQSFYWIQLYKLASGAREHAPIMATTGPGLESTPWPAVWWNLNVQLEYRAVHGSNHLELDAVPRTLAENTDTLIGALRPEYRSDSAGVRRATDATCDSSGTVAVPGVSSTPEVGNLPWALHNVWLTYRHTMDRGVLEDVLYPLLRRATNYYLHFLYEGEDGRLHLPTTHSPEYGNAPDCNYDLALLRWSCTALLEATELLGVRDTLEPKWREVLEKLTDYPVDDNGFMIGAGVPFAKSHRHYSDMLSVYRSFGLSRCESAQPHSPNGLGRTGPRRTQPRGSDTHPVRGPIPGGRFPVRPGHMGTARGGGEAPNHHSGGAGAPHAGAVPGVPDRTITLTRSAQGAASPPEHHHTIELTRRCTTSAPRARSWSARSAGAAAPAGSGCAASPGSRAAYATPCAGGSRSPGSAARPPPGATWATAWSSWTCHGTRRR
ncbi:glycosyl hydrolase family 95 catalytic domain-containing protein [Streptomyces acidicola]